MDIKKGDFDCFQIFFLDYFAISRNMQEEESFIMNKRKIALGLCSVTQIMAVKQIVFENILFKIKLCAMKPKFLCFLTDFD